MNNYLLEPSCMFAFNIWDFTSARSVMDAAASIRKPVILQTSAGIYQKTDARMLRQFVSTYAETRNVQVWLHLDHCRDVETIYDAVKCGWDSVMLDASSCSLNENMNLTNSIIEFARKNGVLVEAEVGQIKGTEDDMLVAEETIADKEEIRHFLKNVKPNMIAVAFGNAHGIYKGSPQLHFELVDYLAEISDIPFVVHGGSGLSPEILRKLIQKRNVKKINISTEVKMAYRKAILLCVEQGLLETDKFQPIAVEEKIHDAIFSMAKEKMELL